jgi:formylglycine-generating enzyme required for sulfatase activity
MGVNTATHKKCGGKCPMESITWQQVLSFIEKLNKKEEGTTYRLPTEAEWEYACRAGTRTTFSWGNVADCSKMNYENGTEGQEDSCSEYVGKKGLRPDSTVPVKTYPPNAWGLYDMHGNVWEWCQDWYGDYPSGSVTDPKGPAKGVYRVGRGGAFFRKAQYCRSATRYLFTPQYGYEGLGFRLVRNP